MVAPDIDSSMSLDRSACERRVYRLATLLTGNPNAATKVIEAVVGAQPDLRRLDSDHLDRLTVLRSREVEPATIVSPDLPLALAEALASLPTQPREAWVLSRVYRLPERSMARSMDCSLTASHRHLVEASRVIAAATGGAAEQAAATLLAYSQGVGVPGFYRLGSRRRRLGRWIKRVLVSVWRST